VKSNDNVFICNSCQKKINLKQPLNFMLYDYIVINKSNMEFVLMLNKVEECLVAPWFAFAQFFQLHGYGQYGMHGSIVNVSTNLNLIQNVLPQMPNDDSFILFYFILKLKYKSICVRLCLS
jgi:hypothetical protein